MSDFDEPISAPENDLHKLAMQIRYDLTAAQGKLTELMKQIGRADLENQPTPNHNGPVPYVPGQLRYIVSTRVVWDTWQHAPDEREGHVRVHLEGFTDDELEVREHIDALKGAA